MRNPSVSRARSAAAVIPDASPGRSDGDPSKTFLWRPLGERSDRPATATPAFLRRRWIPGQACGPHGRTRQWNDTPSERLNPNSRRWSSPAARSQPIAGAAEKGNKDIKISLCAYVQDTLLPESFLQCGRSIGRFQHTPAQGRLPANYQAKGSASRLAQRVG